MLGSTSKGITKGKKTLVLNRPELLQEEVLISARFEDEMFKGAVTTVLGRPAPIPIVLERDLQDAESNKLRLVAESAQNPV